MKHCALNKSHSRLFWCVDRYICCWYLFSRQTFLCVRQKYCIRVCDPPVRLYIERSTSLSPYITIADNPQYGRQI